MFLGAAGQGPLYPMASRMARPVYRWLTSPTTSQPTQHNKRDANDQQAAVLEAEQDGSRFAAEAGLVVGCCLWGCCQGQGPLLLEMAVEGPG